MNRYVHILWSSLSVAACMIAVSGSAAQFARPSGTVSSGIWAPFGAASLHEATDLDDDEIGQVMDLARLDHWHIDPAVMAEKIDAHWLSPEQLDALRTLSGRRFERAWQFHQSLAAASDAWRKRPPATINRIWNKDLEKKLAFLDRVFRVDAAEAGSS